ncbi:MAG: tail fiber domain-containing protein [Caulobacteraceae bacterium]|nr:tail fiber domain-containing protein [Caulobacteraceae bacterium]
MGLFSLGLKVVAIAGGKSMRIATESSWLVDKPLHSRLATIGARRRVREQGIAIRCLAFVGVIGAFVAPGAVNAQTCRSYPNTLTNGSTADASQVMENFNCAALVGSGHFTGNVGIGVSPSAYELDVGGIGRFVSPNNGSTGGVILRDAIGDPNANYLQFVNNTNTSQYGFIAGLKTFGLELGGGNVGVQTASPSLVFYVNGSSGGTKNWTVTSDARLKKDVTQITDALSLVRRLRGVRYRWLSVDERSIGKSLNLPLNEPEIGMIAQEVASVVPEAVFTPAKGSDASYGVAPGSLVPILVEAIKQQQAQIDQQQVEIGQLREQLAALSKAR